jgi:hypothetical protein
MINNIHTVIQLCVCTVKFLITNWKQRTNERRKKYMYIYRNHKRKERKRYMFLMCV